jgi:hypothetical protein
MRGNTVRRYGGMTPSSLSRPESSESRRDFDGSRRPLVFESWNLIPVIVVKSLDLPDGFEDLICSFAMMWLAILISSGYSPAIRKGSSYN